VAGEQLNYDWSQTVKNWKRKSGIRVLSGAGELRSLYHDLNANHVVALHIDGDVFSGGVEVEFLGKKRLFPCGPARISRITQAPVAFAFNLRDGKNRLQVFISDPMDAPKSDVEEQQLTFSLVRRLEKCILDEPEQWCIFRKM
jgi:lauroyl/myristoyl acyltransferase